MSILSPRKVVYDPERKVLIFSNFVFHPFFPVFRRRREISLKDIDYPFLARSKGVNGLGRTTGARYLLPTPQGYIYFQSDRYNELRDLARIRSLLKGNSRLPRVKSARSPHHYAGRIALAFLLIGGVFALWYYYSRVLPTL